MSVAAFESGLGDVAPQVPPAVAPVRAGAPPLRDYQLEAVADVRAQFGAGHRRVLLVMPTGSGKTVTFEHILASAVTRGRRVLILVHRVELIDQISAELDLAGIPYGLIAPGHPETDAPVQMAIVASLSRKHRLARWRDQFDFLVVDEAHHAVAGSYVAVLASQPRAHVLGVTATPERLEGRGLAKEFDAMVEGPTPLALTHGRFLCGSTVYTPERDPDLARCRIRCGDYATEKVREAMNGIVVESAVAEYLRLCSGVRAVVFCVDVARSLSVTDWFLGAGVRAVHLDGETPASDSRWAIAGLGDGSVDVICNCGLISEGLDVPMIGAIIMLRPTASVALYLQMVGRALHPAPGKGKAIIMDFAGNVARHGFPDAPRQWSLKAKARRQREKIAAPRPRPCSCGVLNRANAHRCIECGTDLRTPKERVEIEMRLRQAEQRELEEKLRRMNRRQRIDWAGADEQRLHLVARLNGYARGWVWHRTREINGQSTGVRR